MVMTTYSNNGLKWIKILMRGGVSTCPCYSQFRIELIMVARAILKYLHIRFPVYHYSEGEV